MFFYKFIKVNIILYIKLKIRLGIMQKCVQISKYQMKINFDDTKNLVKGKNYRHVSFM